MKQLTLTQTIGKVENLIDSGNGDAGRLYHILEFLKNKKALYHSDQIYLEKKLDALFSIEEEPIHENHTLPIVQELIDSGKGDAGRLQHIYDMLAKNKPLYSSDQIYLESKLNPQIHEQSTVEIEQSESKENSTYVPPPKKISKKPEPVSSVRGSLPKGWSPTDDSEELNTISKNIDDEKEKIENQKKISNEITLQRSKLTELISHRKENQEKINQEKSSLESQIQDEKFRIETQTKLSKEIIVQQEELTKVKKERIDVIKKIDSEKIKISKELVQQKKQLVQAQLEQEKIEKQIQTEQTFLTKMAEEQKSRLITQAKIAHEIKSKQMELEKTKQDYDDITSQVNEEKAKFAESKKLKKLIKLQEKDLIKAKEERLRLITVISKEKELITKKTQEEKERLKSQTNLAKQLKKEENVIKSLKMKREKMDQQIKIKNQKLREQQQRIKKQINEKDKKLKSLAKKPQSKTKKSLKKTKKAKN